MSRGLANYHFADRGELIQTALAGLLKDEAEPDGRGLTPLFSSMNEQARRAASRDPELLALLQLALGPGAEAKAPALREEYWKRRSQ